MDEKQEELFDCWFVEGELDPRHYGRYMQNTRHKVERVKHNVTWHEATAWHTSKEVHDRARQSRRAGLTPSFFINIAEA